MGRKQSVSFRVDSCGKLTFECQSVVTSRGSPIAIITMPAGEPMKQLHDRHPVILDDAA